MTEQATEFRVPVRRLLSLTVPALVVGIVCALTLWGLSALAGVLQHVLWTDLSSVFGLTKDSKVWIVVMLTLTAVLVGLVIKYVPGHAGPDPATTGLVSKPLPLWALPGLALALVLMLAGGVSLGPENPIMAINAALIVVFGARIKKGTPAALWVGLATAGTIGAMFGTPIAAALMFSELDPGDRRIPLWDRLFPLMVSATAGALVMTQFTNLDMAIKLPAYHDGGLKDLGFAILFGLAGGAVGLAASYTFSPLHHLFRRIGSPMVAIVVAGLILGGLGALGGPITLFKGLDEMKSLPDYVGDKGAGWFFAIAGIKLVALLIAGAAGFRGGRIFPAVFVGVALGFGINALWPSVSLPLAVGAATTGIVVAATRSGWLSFFLVMAIVPNTSLLVPVLLATLAAYLLVTNRPELIAKVEPEPGSVPAPDEPGSADGAAATESEGAASSAQPA